jgi:hypothetical protein
MALALAFAAPKATNITFLLQMLDDYRAWFEHYWCIRTLIKHDEYLRDQTRSEVVTILDRHWDDIGQDSGRITEAVELRELALGSWEAASETALGGPSFSE